MAAHGVPSGPMSKVMKSSGGPLPEAAVSMRPVCRVDPRAVEDGVGVQRVVGERDVRIEIPVQALDVVGRRCVSWLVPDVKPVVPQARTPGGWGEHGGRRAPGLSAVLGGPQLAVRIQVEVAIAVHPDRAPGRELVTTCQVAARSVLFMR